jgi:ubiquinone/menaquinone biosynthesis C-methylase UbiE
MKGDRDEFVPPSRLIGFRRGEFRRVGEKFFQHFLRLAALEPNERVLDVGCGFGRMAVPLTEYLTTSGSYEGFDVGKKAIDWCNERITSKYPNFRFRLIDVRNRYYNPEGTHEASEHVFPYEDQSFDFVFFASVLTHMLPEDVERYLFETSRVLRNRGRCLMTLFLFDEGVPRDLAGKPAGLPFKHVFGIYRSVDAEMPEVAVAYDERFIRQLCKKQGLEICEPIRYGAWRRSQRAYLDILTQDVVLAHKD